MITLLHYSIRGLYHEIRNIPRHYKRFNDKEKNMFKKIMLFYLFFIIFFLGFCSLRIYDLETSYVYIGLNSYYAKSFDIKCLFSLIPMLFCCIVLFLSGKEILNDKQLSNDMSKRFKYHAKQRLISLYNKYYGIDQ